MRVDESSLNEKQMQGQKSGWDPRAGPLKGILSSDTKLIGVLFRGLIRGLFPKRKMRQDWGRVVTARIV